MSSSVLKIIAIITMLIDHTGKALFTNSLIFSYIGRISFPIFAFQISEGYIHTKNLKKYFYRLLIFAFISQIPFSLFLSTFSSAFSLNIFFTLFLGLFSIYLYDTIIQKYNSKLLGILCAIFIAFIGNVIKVDYGFFGVFSIFIFYIFKNYKFLLTTTFIFNCILHFLNNIVISNFYYPNIILCLCTMLPIIFINLYNGKQGNLNKKFKYVFYLFYPIHMLILYVIYCFI